MYILITMMAVALFGGFIDLAWHIWRAIGQGSDGIERALLIFFIFCAVAMPWIVIDSWTRHGETVGFWLVVILIIWRFVGMAGLLVGVIMLRLALRETENND